MFNLTELNSLASDFDLIIFAACEDQVTIVINRLGRLSYTFVLDVRGRTSAAFQQPGGVIDECRRRFPSR